MGQKILAVVGATLVLLGCSKPVASLPEEKSYLVRVETEGYVAVFQVKAKSQGDAYLFGQIAAEKTDIKDARIEAWELESFDTEQTVEAAERKIKDQPQ